MILVLFLQFNLAKQDKFLKTTHISSFPIFPFYQTIKEKDSIYRLIRTSSDLSSQYKRVELLENDGKVNGYEIGLLKAVYGLDSEEIAVLIERLKLANVLIQELTGEEIIIEPGLTKTSAVKKETGQLMLFFSPREFLESDLSESQLSDEEKSILEQRLRLINSMARDLTKEDIEIKVGPWWAAVYDEKTGKRRIFVPPRYILEEEYRYSIANNFHEIGHVEITRVLDTIFFFKSQTRKLLLNALEDPRVDEWEMFKHPRAEDHYLMPLYDHEFEAVNSGAIYNDLEVLPHIQFIDGLKYRYFTSKIGSLKDNPAIKNPKVLEAVERVWDDAQEIFAQLPESEEPTREEKIQKSQRVEEIIKDKIWPVYKELIQESLNAVKEGIESGELEIDIEGMEIPGGAGGEGTAGEEGEKGEGEKGEDEEEGEEGEAEETTASEDQPGQRGSWSLESRLIELEKFKKAAQPRLGERVRKLNLAIQTTVRLLRTALELEAEPELETDLIQGSRVDIKKYIEFLFAGYPNIFEEWYEPTVPDYAFGIVVDESGSMTGNKSKTENAIDAEVVFTEVLSKLFIKHFVMGFSNNHWLHKKPETEPNIVERERIYQEIEQSYERGKNSNDREGPGQGTNDKEALEDAIETIKREDAEHKVIIVITDGDGNLKHNSEVLEKAERQGIKIIGVGIGGGMHYVEDTYTHYILPPTIDELPIAIRDVLIREITRGR